MELQTVMKTKSRTSLTVARITGIAVISVASVVGITTFLVAMTAPTIPVGHSRANPPRAYNFCGDGRVDSQEQCDFGNARSNDGDACSSACRWEYCGDGIVQDNVISRNPDGSIRNTENPKVEQCESVSAGFSCSFDCQTLQIEDSFEQADGHSRLDKVVNR